MIRRTVCLVFIALLLTIAACTSSNSPSLQPDGNHPSTTSSDPTKTTFFPRQEKPVRAWMDALILGTLVLVDNCIRVDSEVAKTSYLLIVPPDFSFSVENKQINILNANGEIVAHIGDRARISGGEINSLSKVDKFIQAQIPSQYTGPYWIIGNEFAAKNPSN